jgi:aspartyl-tRNA(Asn)/glutamyl-tRNA(Gln) amidotransferase subunit A
VLSPTLPPPAPRRRAETADDLADPMHAPYTDCWTVVANLAHLAAVSLPAGRSADDGLPVGVQLAGRSGSDGMLLELAARLEAQGLATAP